jgi:hypothetical protein
LSSDAKLCGALFTLLLQRENQKRVAAMSDSKEDNDVPMEYEYVDG